MEKDKETEGDRLYSEIQEMLQSFQTSEKSYIKKLKLRHKVIFAFIVFFGINLLWYGMWGLVEEIPFLNIPVISLIIGSIILIVTGFFYENMVSTNFGKKLSKKKDKRD